MNRIKIKNILTVVGILCGFTLLLSSCEKEIPVTPGGSGEKVVVDFSITGSDYGAESITRSGDSQSLSETTLVPLGNGLYIEAVLQADAAPSTRAAVNLTAGVKVRIVAFSGTGYDTFEASADYTVQSGGGITPDGSPLAVADGVYKFVAYSYNTSTTLPSYATPITNISPDATDFLWGITSSPVTISSSSGVVSITLDHVFPQIAVVTVTSTHSSLGGATITSLTDVSLATPDSLANLTVYSGVVASGAPAGSSSRSFDFSTPVGIGTGNVSSASGAAPLRLLPRTASEITQINIGNLVLSTPNTYQNVGVPVQAALLRGKSYTLTLNLIKKPDPGIPTRQILRGYNGAFWRGNEIGERIITIDTLDIGPWTAAVTYYDARWNPAAGDGILLALGGSSDPNVPYPDGTGAVANNAESYPITVGGASTVSGICPTTGPGIIQFRIGLQKTFPVSDTPNYTTTFPARYAVVTIYYGPSGNKDLTHRLFLRQGEGADYAPGTTSGLRWPPYNARLAGNFVEFPSQAGYLYRWTNSTTGYHPSIPVSGAYPGWTSSPTGGTPPDAICPTGYRIAAGGGVDSEFRQFAGLALSTVRGKYADGYFDRRAISTFPPITNGNDAVSVTDDNIAYMGYLTFRAADNKSLFFPSGRYRSSNNSGAFYATQNDDGYYLGGGDPSITGNLMIFRQGVVIVSQFAPASRMSALTLRCVRDEREFTIEAIPGFDDGGSASEERWITW